MWMVAIREHGYQGRRVPVGRVFEVRSVKDAAILRVARLARDAKKSEIPKVTQPVFTASPSQKVTPTEPPPQTPQKAVTIEPPPTEPQEEVPTEPTVDEIVYENQSATFQTRDEEPEEVYEESSPPETVMGRSRKKRRQYRRKDMVPE